MQYQVLARKWRPQNFHDVVGQEHVSKTLLNALQSGRVAHAFLFSGPRGSGKTTTARILAKALNCHAGVPGEPCGKCIACSEIAAGNCMDVLEIDAASNTGVDNVRSLIEQVQYSPARDRNRIYIIDEVHMLSNAAFNALLKTLEEPPAHVVFIMATTEHHKIPATILSRCQQYSFKLIQFPLILDRLKKIAAAEKIHIGNSALEQVAFSSGGSMRDAMSALDQVIAFSGESVRDEDVTMLLGLVEPAILAKIVRAIAAADPRQVLEAVAEMVLNGQDLQNFCRRLLAQFRNLMVLKAGVTDQSILGFPESLLPDMSRQAELFSREDLLRVFGALLKVEADLRYATQVRFQLEMGLVEVAHIARLRPLEDLISEFSRLVDGELPGKPATAPGPAPRPERSAAPAAPAATTRPAPAASPPPAPESGRELLLRIAARVEKESLESVLQNLPGAALQGDELTLDVRDANEFLRRQIRDNLPLISRAACAVVGRTVRVALGGEKISQVEPEKPAPVEDVLERAKREPVVQSFLDVFPGPVKAEKLDQ